MKKFSEIKVKKLDLNKIQKDLEMLLNEFNAANTFKEQDKIFKKTNKYIDNIETTISITEVHYTLNTKDKKYAKMKDSLDEIVPNIQGYYHQMELALIGSKFKDDFIKKNGAHLFNRISTSIKCFSEEIIPNLQKINSLSSKYDNILASAQIQFQGETYNLPQMGKFTTSPDRNIRKGASICVANFFQEKDKEIGEIYDSLVKLRTEMAKKLGFKNFVEMGYFMLGRTDYDANDIANYRKQIYEDLVPYTNRLFSLQAKRLGIKNPQYYDYNICFKDGDPKPHGNKDFMVNCAKKMYKELSSETDFFFNYLNDYELMDLEAKPGKVPGGYMTYFPKYKSPFIFSNFNGTAGDVDVLTHEFGHAFQGYISRNISVPDYRSPTYEACEIHSMSMEFITYPWMDLFFEEESEKYKYSHLLDAICFIPYGVTIDEFQHWVYENPEATHEQRCAAYKEIEKKYRPHLKYDEVEIYDQGRFWLKQSHVFGSPFYYIDYTLAQIVAFEFFNEDRKNHEKTWKKYVNLCKLGGKYGFVELLKKAHLKNPFVPGTVKKVIGPLKSYLKEFKDFN